MQLSPLSHQVHIHGFNPDGFTVKFYQIFKEIMPVLSLQYLRGKEADVRTARSKEDCHFARGRLGLQHNSGVSLARLEWLAWSLG